MANTNVIKTVVNNSMTTSISNKNNSNNNFSNKEKAMIYSSVYSSNMKKLSWKYNNCKNNCIFPIQCTFNIKPLFYKIIGNYQLSSNEEYNTILTITENTTTYLYVTVNVLVTVALKSAPNDIILKDKFLQKPSIYYSPAGTYDLIIKSYFNIYSC